MELYLQMGHGMQSMVIELIKLWNYGTVILSPVNIPPNKLSSLAKRIKQVNGNVLFDPQLFYPKEGHIKLQAYDYWPVSNSSITDNNIKNDINLELLRINEEIDSSAIILPAIEMDENKFSYEVNWIKNSVNFFSAKSNRPIFATLCLCSETIRNSAGIENLFSMLRDIPVDGYYIIPHPSNNEYLVSDPLWEIGLMKLITCLKLSKVQVIVGYTNHQGLLYSLANVDAIASGTYMNTRSFVPAKFKSPKDDDIKHKSTWYYLPSAMSEYKAAILDVAEQRNYLDKFKPIGFENIYSDMLFKGARPSSTNYNEPNSFKHYLCCLRNQCALLSKQSYKETYDTYEFLINNAENEIKEFKKLGISGQNRDFAPSIEANRVAMCANDADYGLKLQFEWK